MDRWNIRPNMSYRNDPEQDEDCEECNGAGEVREVHAGLEVSAGCFCCYGTGRRQGPPDHEVSDATGD